MHIANDNDGNHTASNDITGRARAQAHNARLKAEGEARRSQRRAEGIAQAAAHNHALTVDKHKRIYGGYQMPMFG